MGLDFLLGQTSNTATQSALQSTSTQASIKGMARQLNSALSEIKRLWCLFTLEENTGSMSVDDHLLQVPITEEKSRFILELIDSGKLTYQTGMEQLKAGKAIGAEVDINAEAIALGLATSEE